VCVYAHARSWDTVLKDAMVHAGVRSVVLHSIAVCLTGMHPQLHPTTRPCWKARMMALRMANLSQDAVVASAQYVKEAVRRTIASIMATTPATHAALASLGHPVRHLHQPPTQFPHTGMEGAMAAFADAGKLLAGASSAPPESIQAVVAAAFRGRQLDPDADSNDDAQQEIWDPSWLGYARSTHPQPRMPRPVC